MRTSTWRAVAAGAFAISSACGGTGDRVEIQLAGDDKVLADQLADEFVAADRYSRDEAQCFADHLVASYGAPRVREFKSASGAQFRDRGEAEKTVDALVACTKTWKLEFVRHVTEGADRMSDESSTCVTSRLSDRAARELLLAEIIWQHGLSDDRSITYLNPLIELFDQCLSAEELAQLDWN
jgi:hypothetical protein